MMNKANSLMFSLFLLSTEVIAQGSSVTAVITSYRSKFLVLFFAAMPLALMWAAWEMKTSDGGKKGKERVGLILVGSIIASAAVGLASFLRV